jgi:predicted nucleic acid-binding protein
MKYLVDSDYVADYLKGRILSTTLLDILFPEGLAISTVTFAEVYEGIYYGDNPKHYTMIFRRFLAGVTVLDMNRSVAKQFAITRGQLRATPPGKALVQPKDTYDLFIAATALHHQLTLVTRNIKDYERIPNLDIYKAS